MEQETKTLAEKRAEIRRRKILEQGTERMSKILGKSTAPAGSSSDRHHHSPPASRSAPLPGRDLAFDPSQELIANLTIGDVAAAAAAGNSFSSSITPDEISDQLSNLSLGMPNPVVTSLASNFFAQSVKARTSDQTSSPSAKNLLLQLLIMLSAAAAGVIYNQSIIVSFLVLQPILFAASSFSRSKRPTLTDFRLLVLIRNLFDNLLVFIFLSVMTIITRDLVAAA